MRVATRLKIFTTGTLVAFTVLALIFVWLVIEYRDAQRDYDRATAIKALFFERASLRDQYFLHHEERLWTQWKSNKALSDAQLREAEGLAHDEAGRTDLALLRGNIEATAVIFQRIVDSNALTGASGSDPEVRAELERRLSSQLLLRASQVLNSVTALQDSAKGRADRTFRRLSMILGLFALTLSAAIVLVSVQIGTMLRRRLAPLHAGASIVAGGDLEHRIDARGTDEFSELAQSINATTGALQVSTRRLETEITQRAWAETVLRQSNKEQTAMFESATSGIAVVKDRVIVKANRTLDRLFGYGPGEQVGLTTRRWYVNDEAYAAGGAPYAALARGEIHQREDQLVRKDGTKFWCRLSGNAIDAADLSLGAVWMLTDVTHEHETSEALREAKDIAEAAYRAKSEFLANMSHEIRTPLNGVIGNAQLLEMSEPTSEQKEYLNAIMLSGSNLLSLINDILDLSKIEAQKVVLEQVDFSLRGCFNNVVRTQRSRIANKKLSLKLDIPNEVPDALIGDELRVKQILINLLGNAIKFTSAGGITVSAAIKEQTSSRALIELAVTDTGIGIPRAVADDIFKPFVQADGSTTRKYGGSGLGLSISRRLAELMGGSISVESTEGAGSTFRVLLPFPVTHQVVREYSAPAPVALWSGAPLQVLLAEDNAINQQFSMALLRKLGHQVRLAQNGEEVLAALEAAAYDLLLMDIQMPVMGGEEALAVLRERERATAAHLPVIALTAFALKGDEQRFFAAGFDGYVSKPLEVRKLVAEMHRVLDLKAEQNLR